MNPLFRQTLPPKPSADQTPAKVRPTLAAAVAALTPADAPPSTSTFGDLARGLVGTLGPEAAAAASLDLDLFVPLPLPLPAPTTTTVGAAAPSPLEAAAAALLATLRPLRPLGDGAFGRVWLAERVPRASDALASPPHPTPPTSSHPLVAVKQLSLRELAAARQTHRASRELRALQLLCGKRPSSSSVPPHRGDPFLCRFEGAAALPSRGYLFLLLEQCPGGSLLDVLRAGARGERDEDGQPQGGSGGAPPAPVHVCRGLPISRARTHLACLLLALAAVHARGIAHRDVSLDNVLVGADGFPRLCDFGFARSFATRPSSSRKAFFGALCGCEGEEETADPRSGRARTSGAGALPSPAPGIRPTRFHSPAESAIHLAASREGDPSSSPSSPAPPPSPSLLSHPSRARAFSVVGSIPYMAPEVSATDGHDEAADVWSLGVLAAELLTGVSPFTRRTVAEPEGGEGEGEEKGATENSLIVARRAAAADYTLPEDLASVCPEAAAFVRAALCPDPAARPSVSALLDHPLFACALELRGVGGVGVQERLPPIDWRALAERRCDPPEQPRRSEATAKGGDGRGGRGGERGSRLPAAFGDETFAWAGDGDEEEDDVGDVELPSDEEVLSWLLADEEGDGVVGEFLLSGAEE
jgi:serine/threonine protein kinase